MDLLPIKIAQLDVVHDNFDANQELRVILLAISDRLNKLAEAIGQPDMFVSK